MNDIDKKGKKGMKFIDNIMSEKSICVIEYLVRLYESANLRDVRKIILKDVPETIIDKIARQRTEDKNTFLMGMGMFFDDSTTTKIVMDEATLIIFNTLEALSKDILDRKGLLELIIHEWTYSEAKKTCDFYDEEYEFTEDGEMFYPTIRIDNKIWNDFRYICSARNLNVNKGFKIAIASFLHNRYDMCE